VFIAALTQNGEWPVSNGPDKLESDGR